MRIWTGFWLLVVAIVATFAFANWQVLSAPTTINLLVADVTAPLGLTMLGGIVGLMLLFMVFLVWLETRALVEIGRAQKPAESAAPHINELRVELDRQLAGLRSEHIESMRNVAGRFEHLERVIKDEVARASQALSAVGKHAS